VRKIHTGNQVWEYSIRKGCVVIHPPEGKKKIVVDYNILTGRDWSVLDRGQQKGSSDGMIKPSDVKNYIELHLI